jgi:hypothetical protein
MMISDGNHMKLHSNYFSVGAAPKRAMQFTYNGGPTGFEFLIFHFTIIDCSMPCFFVFL